MRSNGASFWTSHWTTKVAQSGVEAYSMQDKLRKLTCSLQDVQQLMEDHCEWVRLLNVLVVDKLQHLYLMLLLVVIPNNAWQPLLASMELVSQQRFYEHVR